MRYFVTVGGRTVEVDLGTEEVRVDGTAAEVDLSRLPGTGVYSLVLDGRSHQLHARRDRPGTWELHLRGRRVRTEVLDERTRQIRELTGAAEGPGGPRPVRAPMPGLVVQVEVEVGQVVGPGDGLLVVEAMKMENELRAEAPATVKEIHVRAGDPVEKDQVLVEFQAPSEEG